jgi:polyhydroxyalkanoate synthesis regulator phasin
MIDLLKKSILFGLGTYEVTREKVEEFVERMKTEEKITPEEGKKLVEDVMSDVEKEGKEYKERVREVVKDVLTELGVATKSDIESLKRSLKK